MLDVTMFCNRTTDVSAEHFAVLDFQILGILSNILGLEGRCWISNMFLNRARSWRGRFMIQTF